MKVPEKYYCDICGKEIKKEVPPINSFVAKIVPAVTSTKRLYGNSTREHITCTVVDLCRDCLLKLVRFTCDQNGENPHFIESARDETYTAERFARDIRRMCASYRGCNNCPLNETVCDIICDKFSNDQFTAVRKWAAEHPEEETS